MKIILEFNDQDDLAAMSISGPKAFSCIEDFREHLRRKVKYSEDNTQVYDEIYRDYLEFFEGMFDE